MSIQNRVRLFFTVVLPVCMTVKSAFTPVDVFKEDDIFLVLNYVLYIGKYFIASYLQSL